MPQLQTSGGQVIAKLLAPELYCTGEPREMDVESTPLFTLQMQVSCECSGLKYGILMENLRCSKANSSGNNFIGKIAYFSQVPRGGGMPCHSTPHRKKHDQSGGRRKERNVGKSLHCGFLKENR